MMRQVNLTGFIQLKMHVNFFWRQKMTLILAMHNTKHSPMLSPSTLQNDCCYKMFYLQKLICNAEHRGTKRQVLQDKIQS
jgi:hypothetical protein